MVRLSREWKAIGKQRVDYSWLALKREIRLAFRRDLDAFGRRLASILFATDIGWLDPH